MAKSSKKAPRKTAKKTATRAAGGGSDLRRHIVARAAADPAFRRRLFADPAAVFGGRLTASDKAAVERMKRMMPALEGIVVQPRRRGAVRRRRRLRRARLSLS